MVTDQEFRDNIRTMFSGDTYQTIADRLQRNRESMFNVITCKCEAPLGENNYASCKKSVHCPRRHFYTNAATYPLTGTYINAKLKLRKITCALLDECARSCNRDPRFVFDRAYTGSYSGPICGPSIATRLREHLQDMHPDKTMRDIIVWYADKTDIPISTAKNHLYKGMVNVFAFAKEMEKADINVVDVLIHSNDK